jgi:hypothetical protein
MRYEIDTRDWGQLTATSGSITYLPNEQAAKLAVTSDSGSKAVLQSNSYFRYQAGKAHWIRMTNYHADVGQTNQVRRWGYFDENNGLFFQLSGTTLSVVRRTKVSGIVVDNVVAQSSWNVDKFNGTGTSGVTLNLLYSSIYEIDFEHLGAGAVFFRINGTLVHKLDNANTIAGPYMSTANLPVRIEVSNTGASTASSMTHICASVESHGGTTAPQEGFGCNNPTAITISTTERPIIAIRPKLLYAGQTNRISIIPVHIHVTGRNSNEFAYRLLLNPATLTAGGGAPTWTSANSRSGVEFTTNADAFTGGQMLMGSVIDGVQTSTEEVDSLFHTDARQLRLDAFGASTDVLLLTGVRIGSGDASALANIHWNEIR